MQMRFTMYAAALPTEHVFLHAMHSLHLHWSHPLSTLAHAAPAYDLAGEWVVKYVEAPRFQGLRRLLDGQPLTKGALAMLQRYCAEHRDSVDVPNDGIPRPSLFRIRSAIRASLTTLDPPSRSPLSLNSLNCPIIDFGGH